MFSHMKQFYGPEFIPWPASIRDIVRRERWAANARAHVDLLDAWFAENPPAPEGAAIQAIVDDMIASANRRWQDWWNTVARG